MRWSLLSFSRGLAVLVSSVDLRLGKSAWNEFRLSSLSHRFALSWFWTLLCVQIHEIISNYLFPPRNFGLPALCPKLLSLWRIQLAFIYAVLVLLRVVKAGPDYVIQKSPLFAVLLAMSMLERLSAFAADVAIERDYVPQLAGEVCSAAWQAQHMDTTSLISTLHVWWCNCIQIFGQLLYLWDYISDLIQFLGQSILSMVEQAEWHSSYAGVRTQKPHSEGKSVPVGKDNPSALAASNAKLRQTDLVSELLGTLAFGWGSAHLGMSTALACLTSVTFLALPLELYYLRRVSCKTLHRVCHHSTLSVFLFS